MSETYFSKIANSINSFMDYLSNSYPLSTLVYFSLFIVILLCGFLLWMRDGYRPSQMKKIAEKYRLNYIGTDKEKPLNIIKNAVIPNYRENIIKGKIKDKEVLVYDCTKFSSKRLMTYGSWAMINRFTVFSVNGFKKKLNRFPLGGVASINKIDSVLADLEKS